MSGQLKFIGREKELDTIHNILSQWGTRKAVFVNAPGGTGKTRLLSEIYKRYVDSEDDVFLVAKILDFDDRALHIPENIEPRLARSIDESAFEPYLRNLLDYHKIEAAGVSVEILQQQGENVHQTLVDNFNKVSDKHRIIVLLDTVDKFESKEVWNRLANLILQTKNVVFFLAGRDAVTYYEEIKPKLDDDAILIDLLPFTPEIGKEYLEQKQQSLYVTFDPELVDKLVFLSHGQPMLIDLAVEWLTRDLPLPWMITPLDEQIPKPQQKDFEIQLVKHIGKRRNLIDRLTLLMARVYPLNQEMLVELLHITVAEAKVLFDEAKSYVFVKSLPDGRISLHDEMRRMVREYVWPFIDPNEEQQRDQSQRTVVYLQRRIDILTEQIEELKVASKQAQQETDVQAELTAFTVRQTTERELWEVREQILYHTIFVDTGQGIATFVEIFDEATETYNFTVRELLLEQMERQRDRLSPKQQYELDSRQVKFLLDTGKYGVADKKVTEILESDIILPEQTVDMLIQRGNIRIRLGQIKEGILDFETAVQISQENNLQDWLARALNARGWAYRQQGNLDAALTDYLEAYRLSIVLNDQKRIAWILNNMGYVNAFKGNQQAALENCLAALELWEEIDFGRGLGATHSNLGEIYRRFDQLSDAMNHYNKALSIFRSENDVEWISIVLCGRASVLRLQDKLDEAEEDLQEALVNSPKNLQPRILYEQAKIFGIRGNLKTASEYLNRCEQLSQEIGDRNHDYRSFVENLEFIWEFGSYARWKELDDHHHRHYASREGEEALRLRGSAYRKLGDLAICHGAYEFALGAYQQGFFLIATNEVHRPYTVGAQLRKTSTHLQQCNQGQRLRSRLGADMIQFWNSHMELIQKYPEALIVFNRWQREE